MELRNFRRACDWAYGAVFQSLLLPAWERGVRGRDTLKHLELLDQSQWLNREALDRLEPAALVDLLSYAGSQVPYYLELVRKERFEPRGVRSRADLAQLPLLTREIVRE